MSGSSVGRMNFYLVDPGYADHVLKQIDRRRDLHETRIERHETDLEELQEEKELEEEVYRFDEWHIGKKENNCFIWAMQPIELKRQLDDGLSVFVDNCFKLSAEQFLIELTKITWHNYDLINTHFI